MRRAVALSLLLAATPVCAQWEFTKAAEVAAAQTGVFPHLDSAGRRSLAVGDEGVAVVWEDNRSGSPQVYVATRSGDAGFTKPRRLSTGGEAFEPAVAAMGGGRFIVVWEQDGEVWACLAGTGGSAAPRRLSDGPARQATVAANGSGRVYAAWSGQRGSHRGIVLARVKTEGQKIGDVERVPITDALEGDQLYPALAAPGDSLVLAWEDRRAGHTRLYVAGSKAGLDLEPARPLNELRSSSNPRYGRGTGVTRVALAEGGGERVAAVWMDKRAFRGGYDIYAAVSEDAGSGFGDNELVQDMFGENTPQWHPTVAVGPGGRVAVAWDDPRDGTPDVWFSWRTGDGEWSDDVPVTPAYGPGAQRSPSVAFGGDGTVHFAWVERVEGQPQRLLYATARRVQE